jgi:acyl-coenzyme A synthetase/AMP-(fatty) acid ligase
MTEAASRAEALVWRGTRPLSRTDFMRDASAIAGCLPSNRYVVNLCEHRKNFLLLFAASLLAKRTQLMPAARGETALAELRADYPDSTCVSDEDVKRWRAGGTPAAQTPELVLEDDRLVMIGFTSGSTGKSQAHVKHWRALANSARLNSAAIRGALDLPESASLSIVGTVPAHHMYGIELTVLLPLFAGMSVHAERPLFPADVAQTLAEPAGPRVLVSTPLHLRALAESGMPFPDLELIVSATAPLDPVLAKLVEDRLGAPLLEMFGSTETCVFATRQTARQGEWRLYDGISFEPHTDSTTVSAAWYERPQQLQDVLERREVNRFVLLGRNSDLVEVAGKRASLADITRRLCAVPGVEDAVAFQPDAAATGVANRVAAVVVSQRVGARQIANALAGSLDAVFLPRPLVLVDRIPRDAVGKVSRARLLELARGQGSD